MIVAVDQLVWRPAVAWAQKFRVEETAASGGAASWVLDLLRRSRVCRRLAGIVRHARSRSSERRRTAAADANAPAAGATRRAPARCAPLGSGWSAPASLRAGRLGRACISSRLLAASAAARLAATRRRPRPHASCARCGAGARRPLDGAGRHLDRPLAAPRRACCSRSSRSPPPSPRPCSSRSSRLRSSPLHVPFTWGCVALMLLGAQWYILFNVLAGASAMPARPARGRR